ncbi:MAG: exodeoxyribonuclease VII large subunit [Bacteroidales bacterium]|nr:exodeoxyribonuclease VII large subunit [Bacteroidales bacterium]MDY5193954.1 exodeoxyribonuclease VII large subunit [Candidatus Aphodosoma sp.]
MNYKSLYELNNYISRQIRSFLPSSIWVTAEISSVTRNASGHCYIELVEKSETNDNIIARQRATIWASKYVDIHRRFVEVAQSELKAGISILFCCDVQFHELYGMSLNIIDIDPIFTVGDIQRRKQEIIKRLTEEGLLKLNSLLPLPMAPKNIAVISSNTAAGYGDFVHQLFDNNYGFDYNVTLFRSVMQGDKTEDDLMGALSDIAARVADFDIVVIIRGGGSTTDLQAFDSEKIARQIAHFPLPVIVGIGHLRDNTILDMVAARSVKTPTAAAEFIINLSVLALNNLASLENRFCTATRNRLQDEIISIDSISRNIISFTDRYLIKHEAVISEFQALLPRVASSFFINANNKLNILETKVNLLNPINLLSKGYTLTIQDEKIITSVKQIDYNIPMKSIFFDGEVLSNPMIVEDENKCITDK